MIRLACFASFTLLLAACSPQAPDEAADDAGSTPAEARPVADLPPPIPNPLEIGSQDARDDLYCAGLIFAANPEPREALVPVEHALALKMQGLALGLSLEGTSKLIAEGAALPLQTGDVAAAWGDLAYDDLMADRPKLPLETCIERARTAALAYADQ